jgi:hypothetical protein
MGQLRALRDKLQVRIGGVLVAGNGRVQDYDEAPVHPVDCDKDKK